MEIEGVDFPSAWNNKREADFDGVTADFIGLDELIQNKRSAARPQDLIDLENLENVRG